MLVISRCPGETIRIGDDIVITLVKGSNSRCRIGIDAPKRIKILRGELKPLPEGRQHDERGTEDFYES